MNKVMKNKRMDELASDWIESNLRFIAFDCCDSMHDLDRIKAKWEEYSDKPISDHVKKSPTLMKKYEKEILSIREDCEYDPFEDCELEIPIPKAKRS